MIQNKLAARRAAAVRRLMMSLCFYNSVYFDSLCV